MNVLNAKVSDMTVRLLNDSLARFSEVQKAVVQKMVDIGEEMPGPMTPASTAKLRGEVSRGVQAANEDCVVRSL